MACIFDKYPLTDESSRRIEISWKFEEVQFFLASAFMEALNFNVFIDIGANVGAYTLLAMEDAHIEKIYAYEPNPAAFAELIHNCAGNAKVRMMDCALSDCSGITPFLDFGKISGKDCIPETSIHKANGSRTIQVQKNTLDNLLLIDGKRIYIKIDVEGHEANALKGMERILTENKVLIQIEIGHSKDKVVEEFLDKIYFRKLFEIGPDGYFCNFNLNSIELLNINIQANNNMVQYRWK